MKHFLSRRVVITGIGAITPLGNNIDIAWNHLIQGKSGIRLIDKYNDTNLPTRIAAPVIDFEPTNYLAYKEVRRTPRFAQFALVAAIDAIRNANLNFKHEDLTRIGVEVGSSLGGTDLIEEQQSIFKLKGQKFINPSLIPSILINSAACLISIQHGIVGPVNAPVAACATGVVAIGNAFRRLQYGEVDVMIAGGSDSVISPLSIAGFSRLGACSTKNSTPEKACSPFDANRDGTVVGEGAAIIVLETLEHAKARNAPILAEVIGFGLSNDAFHLVMPEPTGLGASLAIQNALEDARIMGNKLNWICAHGTGTIQNDLSETKAIKRALGNVAYSIPVSSIKGGIGHMLGAAGAISIAAAVKAIEKKLIPPTINYETPDPECDLDYVPVKSRESLIEYVLVNGFGFGGQNACLICKSYLS